MGLKKTNLILFLVASMLLCCGCSAPVSQDSDSCPWDETKIALPNGVKVAYDIYTTNDGDLMLAAGGINAGVVQIYSLQKNGQWEPAYSLGETLENETSGLVPTAVSGGEDGTVVCIFSNDDRSSQRMILVDANGVYNSLELDASLNKIISAKLLEETRCYIVDEENQLSLVDISNGESLYSIEAPSNKYVADYDIVDDALYVIWGDADEYLLKEYRIDTGELSAEVNLSGLGPMDKSPLLYVDGGSVGLLSSAGISKVDGDEASLVSTLDGTNLTNAGMIPIASASLDDGSFCVEYLLPGNMLEPCAIYHYAKQIEAKEKKELVLYTLYENTGIEQAVASFRDVNPNVNITVRTGIVAGSEITPEDAIRSLNADIVSGNAPDLILLDGLPYERMAKEGYLANLGEMVDSLTVSGKYFDNVIRSVNVDDDCYGIPTRLSLPGLVGSSDAIAAIDGLEGFDADDVTYSSMSSLRALCIAYFAGSDNLNNREMLENFLVSCKSVVSQIEGKEEDSGAVDYAERLVNTLNRDSKSHFGMSPSLIEGTSDLEVGVISDAGTFGMLQLNADYIDDGKYGIFEVGGISSFEPMSVVGMSSTCNNVNEAKAFIDFLLSDTQQTLTQLTGIPVNKSSLSSFLEQIGGYEISKMGSGTDESYSIDGLGSEEIGGILSSISQCSSCYFNDEIIEEIIKSAVIEYCIEEKPLDEIASEANRKISLYCLQQS
mgnify:FL=1